MKKIVLSIIAAGLATVSYAGGILTNTNQNAAFLRQMSQNAIIDINGLYVNPAGTAFLEDGWHLSLNIQNARQQRNITTSLPYFAYNVNTPGEQTHRFEGKAYAPVIPSFQLSYNHKKWSVNANFALCGGGGKCEFEQGLGSFEALYASNIMSSIPALKAGVNAAVPGVVSQKMQAAGLPAAAADALAASGTYDSNLAGYNMDAYMRGRQYYFGLTLGATYKITDNIAFFGGVRGVYASCNYNGYVQDVTAKMAYTYNVPATSSPIPFPGTSGNGNTDVPLNSDLTLNTDQSGFGITPIVGLDWRINEHWNLAAKYEWKTRMRLENSSEMNNMAKAQAASAGSPLSQFADGKKVAADIPGLLTLGAQYSPCKVVRMNAGFNYYLDQDATQFGGKEDLLDKNTWELTAGAEWDICKWFTISASWQKTQYGFSDAYMNDLSFNLPSNSLGVGFRVNPTEKVHIDFGYMHTFYKDMTVATLGGAKVDTYERKNRVFGLGVNLDF